MSAVNRASLSAEQTTKKREALHPSDPSSS